MGGEPKGERLMTSTGWSFVETAARLLARDEREAVLGDFGRGQRKRLARAAGRARLGFPGGSDPLEELAAMAGGIRSGPSKQLSPYGVLAVCQLELSDHTMPRASPEVVPDTGLWVPGIAVPGTPSDRLVLDGRFCSRIVVAADSLG